MCESGPIVPAQSEVGTGVVGAQTQEGRSVLCPYILRGVDSLHNFPLK